MECQMTQNSPYTLVTSWLYIVCVLHFFCASVLLDCALSFLRTLIKLKQTGREGGSY